MPLKAGEPDPAGSALLSDHDLALQVLWQENAYGLVYELYTETLDNDITSDYAPSLTTETVNAWTDNWTGLQALVNGMMVGQIKYVVTKYESPDVQKTDSSLFYLNQYNWAGYWNHPATAYTINPFAPMSKGRVSDTCNSFVFAPTDTEIKESMHDRGEVTDANNIVTDWGDASKGLYILVVAVVRLDSNNDGIPDDGATTAGAITAMPAGYGANGEGYAVPSQAMVVEIR
jgi:hypothetical protein